MTERVLGAIVVGFHVERGRAVRVVVVVILDNERRSAERAGWGDRSNSNGSGNDDSVYDNVVLFLGLLCLCLGDRGCQRWVCWATSFKYGRSFSFTFSFRFSFSYLSSLGQSSWVPCLGP